MRRRGCKVDWKEPATNQIMMVAAYKTDLREAQAEGFKFPTCRGVGNTASIHPKRLVRNA